MKIPVEVDIHKSIYIYIVYNYYVEWINRHVCVLISRCHFFSTVETLDFENIDILMIFACLSGPIILCYSGDLCHLSHHFEAQSTAHPLPRVQSTCHGLIRWKIRFEMWQQKYVGKNKQTKKRTTKQASKQPTKQTNKQTNPSLPNISLRFRSEMSFFLRFRKIPTVPQFRRFFSIGKKKTHQKNPRPPKLGFQG